MRTICIGALTRTGMAIGLMIGSSVLSPLAASASEQAQQMPPRDLRPGEARPATKQETDLQKRLATSPADPQALLELAKLQENRGAVAEAESTLLRIQQLGPANAATYRSLAAAYQRLGKADRAVEALERAASLQPGDAEAEHLVATYYLEMSRAPQVTATDKAMYLQRGLGAEQRALDINPDFLEALVYRNILLRVQANMETDPAKQQALIAEADGLRNRALELQKNRPPRSTTPGQSADAPPPPPPPPPPAPGAQAGGVEFTYATTSYSVTGNAPRPRKLKDVAPVYPPMAMTAGVQGVVEVEATIDAAGRVSDARIVQSVRMLDQSAIDAVKQWLFEPATGNAPTPVMINVKVNFSPKK
jgi:TonB family protein